MKTAFMTILLAAPIAAGFAHGQAPNGASWVDNGRVIITGGPGSGPGTPGSIMPPGSNVAIPVATNLASTNLVRSPVAGLLTNTNRFVPGVGIGSAAGGANIDANGAGTITGSGVGPNTTLGGQAGVDGPPAVSVPPPFVGGLGGTIQNVNSNMAVGPNGRTVTGAPGTVGGLGTGSGGTGPGRTGVGGLGTGSSGMGTGTSGVGGLGTGSGGVGTGIGASGVPPIRRGPAGTGAGSGIGGLGTGSSGTGTGTATR